MLAVVADAGAGLLRIAEERLAGDERDIFHAGRSGGGSIHRLCFSFEFLKALANRLTSLILSAGTGTESQ
ncbi:MAG: hypothetical protein WEH44_04110 [Pirellulaceae bacterium]